MKAMPYSTDQAACERCYEHGQFIPAYNKVGDEHLCDECDLAVREETAKPADVRETTGERYP